MEQEQTSGGGYGKLPLWKWLVIYVILAVIIYGLIYFFVLSKKGGYAPSPSQTYSPTTQNISQPASSTASQSSTVTQPPANVQTPANVQDNIVNYTDSGFSPSTLTVKKGDTVIFKNTATDDVLVGSNPHPIHSGYPTKGGCISSTFDSCGNISPGKTWSFKFDVIGTWRYHNHLNASEGGTIVVQ